MGRFGLSLAMVAVWTGIAWAGHGSRPPQQVLARMAADGQLELWQQGIKYVTEEKVRTKTVYEEQAVDVEKEVDGQKVKETVTKKVPRQVPERYYVDKVLSEAFGMKADKASTKYFETDGRPANAATVAQRLSKPTLVLLVWDDKPPPDYYAGVFKPGTLVIAIQPAAPRAAERLGAPATGRTAVSLLQNLVNRTSLPDAGYTVPVLLPEESRAAIPRRASWQLAATASLQVEPRTAIPPDVKFPNAPPPQLVFGSRDGQGNLSLRTINEYSFVTTAQIEEPDSSGKPLAKDIQLKIAHRHSTVVQVPEQYVKAWLAGGRRVEQRELAQLLPRESTLVASQDGQPVDPFWLQNIKPTILVVVPPRGSLGDQGVATVAMPAPTVEHPQPAPAPPPATETPVPKKAPAAPAPQEAPVPQPAKPPAPAAATTKSGPQSRAQTNQNSQSGDDKFNAAIADLNEKIRRDPGNPGPHYAMAFVQHKAGRVNDARTSVLAARGLEKKRPIADWGRLMERYQGPSRIWLEDARRKPIDELLTPEPLPTEPLPPAPVVATAPTPALPPTAAPTKPGTAETTPSPVDRRAAEWVLRVGGAMTILVGGVETAISKDSKLPETPFHITRLELAANPNVKSDELKFLEKLTNVESVEIFHNETLKTDFAFLKDMLKLRELDANLVPVMDDALVNLKQLTKLQVLKLAGSQVTDAGLKHLAGLKELQELALPMTSISDEGLKHLSTLTKLTTLHVQQTKVTEAGAASLKAALPECHVITKGDY